MSVTSPELIERIASETVTEAALAALEAAAAGDFSAAPEGDGRAERAVRAVIARLRAAAIEQLDGAVALSMSLNETAVSCASLRHSANGSAKGAQSVAVAAQEISAAASAIDEAVSGAHQAASALSAAARKGGEAANEAADQISCIAGQVDGAYNALSALNKVSDEISGIAGAIFDIATKTNLLAVNASIEAARAGAAGRGFAIVAEEVRALSEQTGAATGQVRGGVDNLRREVGRVSSMMLTARDAAAGGAETISAMNAVMSAANADTSDQTDNVDQAMGAIVETLAQQRAATRDLAANAESLSACFQETLQAVHRADMAVDGALEVVQAGFQRAGALEVPAKVLRMAKADHVIWKKKLADLALGKQGLSGMELSSHQDCRLGRWYFGACGRALQGSEAYRALNAPHKAVHDAGMVVADAVRQGDLAKALSGLDVVERASAEVIRLLDVLISEEMRRQAR